MAQTIANLTSVLKDVWTSDRVAKQFYNQNPVLDKMTAIQATMIGLQAQVPIHKYRSGGFTTTAPAGGTLNPADNQKTDQAIYTMVYNWFQIAIETAALNQSGSSLQSIIAAKDLEMQGAIDDVSKHVSRQLCSGGDSLIAQCTTTTAATVINLLPQASGGLGYDAIVRGWLYPGLRISVGTTGTANSILDRVQITDVGEDPVTPTITTATSVTTSSSHFVSIGNPNGATAVAPELNGFRNIVSPSTSLGGINPATAGEGFWKAALVDSTTTSLSLDLMVNAQRAVYQKRGDWMTDVVTSPKQAANFYLLLQNQVRFGSDTALSAGNVGDTKNANAWNGNGIQVYPDIVDKEMYFLTLADFVRITGSITKPTWTSDLEGAGGSVRWGQGSTAFNEGLVFPLQVGVQRRNTHAALTNLVA